MNKRHRLTTRERAALFERRGGVCHLCGGLVQAGQDWDNSHDIPLACGGKDDESNWYVAHRRCHRDHTARVDAPKVAKTRHQRQKHMGAKQRGWGRSEKVREPLTKVAAGKPAFARRFK